MLISSKPTRKRVKSLVESAYDEIKRRILSSEFSPNYQATEGDLAELLEMSRTPVHEALILLEREHLVENIPRRGMRVLPVSATDMLEIYQVLTALECQAVELIAIKASNDKGASALSKLVDKMDAALERDDMKSWASADAQFHRSLFEFCGNKRLSNAGLVFRDQVDRARMLTLPLRQGPLTSNRAHRELVELIAAGNSEGAFDAHRKHRLQVTKELTEIIERFSWVTR